MLPLELKSREFYDENLNKFFTIKGRKIILEHSLVSISKWESEFKKPFFKKEPMSADETRAYIKCMTITQNVPEETYYLVTDTEVSKVNEYINDSKTATTIKRNTGRRNNGSFVTSELVYYWMIQFGIPMKCEKWHFSRLWALLEICNEENKPKKKLSRSQQLANMVHKNEQRLKHRGI